jgi:hypothetical protein
MGKTENRNKSTAFYIILTIVIIAILSVAIYFIVNQSATSTSGGISTKSIKNETITAENYEEMMNKIDAEFNENDEELYYLTYSMMYYMVQDGLSSALTNSTDDSAMYTSIYGKTVQQLIDEGKTLMKENNVTLEQYKESINELNDIDA